MFSKASGVARRLCQYCRDTRPVEKNSPDQEEQRLVAAMRESLIPGRVQTFPDGREEIWLVGETAELEGIFPETQLVVQFRLVGEPDVVYGWKHPIWTDPDDSDRSLLFMHFDEAAQTRAGRGGEADAAGVVWLPNFFDSF